MADKLTTETQVTHTLTITYEQARALLPALEQAAYLARGAGHEEKALVLWGLFHSIAEMHFGDYDPKALRALSASLADVAAMRRCACNGEYRCPGPHDGGGR